MLVHSRTSKFFSKNHNEDWYHKYLLKFPIVPRKDFGLLGVKILLFVARELFV
jgi:hypothetical protein